MNEELEWVTKLSAVPSRPSDGHKGTFGTVVVVGGSAMMPGAPALCATAAFRAGAGLVKVACEAGVLSTVVAVQPSVTGMMLDDVVGMAVKDQQVLAVGPGLGLDDETKTRVVKIFESDHPLVLDADGLNALASHGPLQRSSSAAFVLTPHPGEFRRLAETYDIEGDPTDIEQRPAAAMALAQATGGVVVLKGQATIVSDGQRVYRNTTGNPALATAGSGDVLTGLIASLLAQGMSGFEAAQLGVYLHGDSADVWAARHGEAGLLAMDLASELPEALRRRRARGGG